MRDAGAGKSKAAGRQLQQHYKYGAESGDFGIQHKTSTASPPLEDCAGKTTTLEHQLLLGEDYSAWTEVDIAAAAAGFAPDSDPASLVHNDTSIDVPGELRVPVAVGGERSGGNGGVGGSDSGVSVGGNSGGGGPTVESAVSVLQQQQHQHTLLRPLHQTSATSSSSSSFFPNTSPYTLLSHKAGEGQNRKQNQQQDNVDRKRKPPHPHHHHHHYHHHHHHQPRKSSQTPDPIRTTPPHQSCSTLATTPFSACPPPSPYQITQSLHDLTSGESVDNSPLNLDIPPALNTLARRAGTELQQQQQQQQDHRSASTTPRAESRLVPRRTGVTSFSLDDPVDDIVLESGSVDSSSCNSQKVTLHHPPDFLTHQKPQHHHTDKVEPQGPWQPFPSRQPQFSASPPPHPANHHHHQQEPSSLPSDLHAESNSPLSLSSSSSQFVVAAAAIYPHQQQHHFNPGWRRRPSKTRSLTTMTGSIKRSMSTPNVQQVATAHMVAHVGGVDENGGSGMQGPYSIDKRRNKLGYHRTSVACGEFRSFSDPSAVIFALSNPCLFFSRLLPAVVVAGRGWCIIAWPLLMARICKNRPGNPAPRSPRISGTPPFRADTANHHPHHAGHCRRRKIRCLLAKDDAQRRCSNCIRLKKDCNFYPVETTDRRPRSHSKPDPHAPPGGGDGGSNGSSPSPLQPPREDHGYATSVPVTPTFYPDIFDPASSSTSASRRPSLAHMHVMPLPDAHSEILRARRRWEPPHLEDPSAAFWRLQHGGHPAISSQSLPNAPAPLDSYIPAFSREANAPWSTPAQRYPFTPLYDVDSEVFPAPDLLSASTSSSAASLSHCEIGEAYAERGGAFYMPEANSWAAEFAGAAQGVVAKTEYTAPTTPYFDDWNASGSPAQV